MENQYSDLFLMQHLASISHQKIYPNIQSKVEMPLWKTLQITRLWNHAREQEIYLLQQQQQQQQKSDWWFNQMTTNNDDDSYLSHQLLDNYLPPSWFDDTTTTTTNSTTTAETDQDPTTTFQQQHSHNISLLTDDASECELDSNITVPLTSNITTNTANTNNSTTMTNNDDTTTTTIVTTTTNTNTTTTTTTTSTTATSTTTDRVSLLSHTPVESLWTQDDLVSLLAVTNQDRKRKHEEDPSTVCQGNPTSPPATRAPSSPPMLKV